MASKNLWLLTEEMPKKEVIGKILDRFCKDNKFSFFVGPLRILPVLKQDKFTFIYEVVGFNCRKINKIYIKSITGNSSFVDFLVFYQKDSPKENDAPSYAIEETKTDDSESRNTGVYQRATKFVLIEYFYSEAKKIMLYNLKIEQKKKPTDTYIFGTRLLLTLGVDVIGKKLDPKIFQPFISIDEIINFKAQMRSAHRNNVPISITKQGSTITISGRLNKGRYLAYDPNIGALSLISSVLRKLGWSGKIIITNHGLEQKSLTAGNKFIQIANRLNLKMDGLNIPIARGQSFYWKYDYTGEKLGTIFVQIVVENFTEGFSIFENHAGCEKSYFVTRSGVFLQLEKYSNREKYKKGDKTKIISIPDLILIDFKRSQIINIEGKRYEFRKNGVRELKNFGDIEKKYVQKYYPSLKIIRTVVLYGGTEKKIIEIEVGFLLNKEGELVLGIKAPDLFKEALKNLIDFWS